MCPGVLRMGRGMHLFGTGRPCPMGKPRQRVARLIGDDVYLRIGNEALKTRLLLACRLRVTAPCLPVRRAVSMGRLVIKLVLSELADGRAHSTSYNMWVPGRCG
jgi:hypothetical protein